MKESAGNTEIQHEPQRESLSNKAFIINMINSCIGVGLLAKPYALCIAGWYSIISVLMAFVFVVYASYLMARVTMKACAIDNGTNTISYDDDVQSQSSSDDNETYESVNNDTINKSSVYRIIGTASLGVFGEYYINVSIFSVTVLLSINIIIIQSQLITGIIDHFVPHSAETVFYTQDYMIFIYLFISLVPTVLISKWKDLTFVGILSTISVVVLLLTMILVFITALCQFPGGYVPSSYYNNEHQSHNTFDGYEINDTAQYAMEKMTTWQLVFFSFLTFKSGMAGI